jgi:hypothetical protein
MRRISKRLEALERAATKRSLQTRLPSPPPSHITSAAREACRTQDYARALGYRDLDQICQATAYLFSQQKERVGGRAAHEARIHRARCELLGKFGYDLRRARPAALADARYRIVRTLPEEWLAMIISAHREECEDEARTTQFLQNLMERAEE